MAPSTSFPLRGSRVHPVCAGHHCALMCPGSVWEPPASGQQHWGRCWVAGSGHRASGGPGSALGLAPPHEHGTVGGSASLWSHERCSSSLVGPLTSRVVTGAENAGRDEAAALVNPAHGGGHSRRANPPPLSAPRCGKGCVLCPALPSSSPLI